MTEDEDLDAEAREDDIGEILRDIDDLIMAGYSREEARYRLGYDIRRGERTV
jgi:hypothetical protein